MHLVEPSLRTTSSLYMHLVKASLHKRVTGLRGIIIYLRYFRKDAVIRDFIYIIALIMYGKKLHR